MENHEQTVDERRLQSDPTADKPGNTKISRRKLLGVLGMTGAAFAANEILSAGDNLLRAKSVSEQVYGPDSSLPHKDAQHPSPPQSPFKHNVLADRDMAEAHPASAILDASGKTQQQLNNLLYSPTNGTPYVRTIFEFMPQPVIDDVFGAKALDHSPYFQEAIDSLGSGGVLWIPLTSSAQINIGTTVNITSAHRSLKIIGTRGTASRDSSLATFKWTGAADGGVMFDILQSWGITFEDCSFNAADRATNIVRLRAETNGLPVRPSHRHNFVRCGFGSAYKQLVVIGDGGNEDMINIKFDSCQFDYYSGNTTSACPSGIFIDAPQSYSIDFDNCLFARAGYPNNFFHIRAGSVNINSACFDGNFGSVDIYLQPYIGAISPQLTVTHAETQSDWFLKTVSGTGIYPTRTVLLQNIRHRADNGQAKPMSIYWDLGHQCQLVHVGCALHGIEIGPNAASVVEVAPQWGRTGGAYPITGYEGNLSVLTGLNGFNITESNRTSKGGLRIGENIFCVSGDDGNDNPLNLPGNKVEGDFWINNKSSIAKSKPAIYRYVGTRRTLMSDSVVHQTYTKTVTANAGKYDYALDSEAVPQMHAIYEVRWNILADRTNTIYEAGVFQIFVKRVGATIQVVKVDVSKSQQATPIIATGVTMWNGSVETPATSASQAALNTFVIRLKFLGILDGLVSGTELNISMRRIGH
ncbi:hypothetical protein FE783_30720 [Paenibacillus mesophilus]|uniref:hypothetical protein n=1 Tax=Paenibacillus mesophilus TaxID=2582849 RepID=UPI00110E2DAE|nr:hypothetical protein [Paenibacillus mesophilus]TMV45046.1 hypothetical protein FE783_30720 [Paenibacillus mesophilus]